MTIQQLNQRLQSLGRVKKQIDENQMNIRRTESEIKFLEGRKFTLVTLRCTGDTIAMKEPDQRIVDAVIDQKRRQINEYKIKIEVLLCESQNI